MRKLSLIFFSVFLSITTISIAKKISNQIIDEHDWRLVYINQDRVEVGYELSFNRRKKEFKATTPTSTLNARYRVRKNIVRLTKVIILNSATTLNNDTESKFLTFFEGNIKFRTTGGKLIVTKGDSEYVFVSMD